MFWEGHWSETLTCAISYLLCSCCDTVDLNLFIFSVSSAIPLTAYGPMAAAAAAAAVVRGTKTETRHVYNMINIFMQVF